MERKKLTPLESDLIAGLEGIVTDLRSGKPLTCRRLVLNLEPQTYTPEQVKATRELLHLSQALFAKFLGVSRKSVCAWEQGREPPAMACRFMDEIQRNPEHFRKRVKSSLVTKPTAS